MLARNISCTTKCVGQWMVWFFNTMVCYVIIYDVIWMNNSWYMIIVRRVSYRVRNNHCHFLLFFRVSLWYFFNLFFYLSNAIFFVCNFFFVNFFIVRYLFSSSTFSTLFRTVAKTGPSVDLTPSCSPRWVLTLDSLEFLSFSLTS